jgi:predicted Zn-dependent protease
VGGPASTLDQEEYYRHLEGIVLGKNPRNGFEEDGVFYHPDLEFQFPVPTSWTVQNQPNQVALIQPDQEAFVVFDISQESSADASASKLTGQEGVTVVDRRSTSINGNPAERVVVEGEAQQGQTIRLLAYMIEYGGNVYRFQGLTTAGQYGTYSSVFERTMTGFARLTDPGILNVQPTRLAIRPAPRTASFRTFIDEKARPEDMSAEDLAIINQVQLDETVQQGRPLKLPE